MSKVLDAIRAREAKKLRPEKPKAKKPKKGLGKVTTQDIPNG